MKTIQIDANSIHKENGEIYLSEAQVRFFNLDDGMEVNAYEGEDVWKAVVHKFISSDGCEEWYVKLCGLIDMLDEKRNEWSSIGFMNGVCTGEEREKYTIVQRMIDLGYGFEDIDKVVCMNDIMKVNVRKIFNTSNNPKYNI